MEEKAKLEIASQKLDNKKKRLQIVETHNALVVTRKKIMIDQIKNLKDLITETVLDVDRTIFATEPKHRPVFDTEEIKKLKKKIWDLLEQI